MLDCYKNYLCLEKRVRGSKLILKAQGGKFSRPIFCVMVVFILAACGRSSGEATPTPTYLLPSPQVFTTNAPDPESSARQFLQAWAQEDYSTMYAQLTPASQSSITQKDFSKRYQDVANEAALDKLDFDLTSSSSSPPDAEVDYQITLSSAIIGNIIRDMKMHLVLDQGRWLVDWHDGLILPELAGGNYLSMDSGSQTRAAIYDRNGNPLAGEATAAAIGVWPEGVDLKDNGGLLSLLSSLSNYRYDAIVDMIKQAVPGDYIPLGEIPVDQDPRRLQVLANWGWPAVMSEYTRRIYYGNGIASHVIGYVSAIQAEELADYRRKGYRSDDRVGRKGIEQWGEDILMGKRGGTLYVFGPDGKPISELGTVASEPGQEITTTLDRDFQNEVQKALSVYDGAIVVLERDTGRVLAMASSPGFDPNAYEYENDNSTSLINQIVNNPRLPQFNRATQGQYPLGSVFKIITMSAALESGRFTPESTYDCQYEFTELPGLPLFDWTWDHFQKDGETQPSGMLTLPQGLIRSCNPWFWHIGLDLFNNGLTKSIAEMSRGFGLGSKTGLEGVEEEAGNIPEPATAVDATNLAIGQGDMLVTPLQVARFVAAMGNGGVLYRPQLIEKIAPSGGAATFSFKPDPQGKLPIKPSTLQTIQEAMKAVVSSRRPPGTAYRPMAGLDIPVAGKTGTATAPAGDPHAWFAGYTFAERPDKPDIAIAVIAENAGEGSEIAAPIFRRVVELYFYGKPLKLYRWESAFDVTREPTDADVTVDSTPRPGFINP
jgi:penicillin-binding protein 2